MKIAALKYFEALKKQGITGEQEELIRRELQFAGEHELPENESRLRQGDSENILPVTENIYTFSDLIWLQAFTPNEPNYYFCLRALDKLLEQDKRREKDGFPRKIRVGRLIKPGKGGKDKIVVVPTTVEEKFFHDVVKPPNEESESGGSGSGEQGEVIGEQPVHDQEGAGSGPGEGEGGQHEMESSAYDLGKILTEKFELPNLQNKGKKRSLTRYTYDLTDRHRGVGQILDKKATLYQIIKTNIALGNVSSQKPVDPEQLLLSPRDKVYRILSKEKDFEAQAVVFFLRDYSGSMWGKPTELVVSQHVLIYSWLLYQFEKQVETRFILHDTDAKEVPDFYTYYSSKVAGGTKVASAYKLVNEIVEQESLVQDYNIYVFHGTDGDDWDTDGKESLPEIEKMLTYVNRIGLSIATNAYIGTRTTEVEKYLRKSGLLTKKSDLIRLDVIPEGADEPRLIEGIKKLIS